MPRSGKSPASPSADQSGVPGGIPYTLYFPRRGGYTAADIAYAAPLPRVGDTVEHIGVDGVHRRFTVREVVHTVQEQSAAENDIPLLAAGLPAVYLTRSRTRPHA